MVTLRSVSSKSTRPFPASPRGLERGSSHASACVRLLLVHAIPWQVIGTPCLTQLPTDTCSAAFQVPLGIIDGGRVLLITGLTHARCIHKLSYFSYSSDSPDVTTGHT